MHMASLLYRVKTSETRHVYGAAAGTGAGITLTEQDRALQAGQQWNQSKIQCRVPNGRHLQSWRLRLLGIGWDGSIRPSPTSLPGLSAGTKQKVCASFEYSFYIATDVLVLRGWAFQLLYLETLCSQHAPILVLFKGFLLWQIYLDYSCGEMGILQLFLLAPLPDFHPSWERLKQLKPSRQEGSFVTFCFVQRPAVDWSSTTRMGV